MTFVISHTGFSGFIYHDPLRQRHKAHARVPRAATAHAAIASAAAPSPKKLTARRPRTSRRHLAGHTMRPLGTRPLSSPRGSLEHHLCTVARSSSKRAPVCARAFDYDRAAPSCIAELDHLLGLRHLGRWYLWVKGKPVESGAQLCE